jgi:hypothetical protein
MVALPAALKESVLLEPSQAMLLFQFAGSTVLSSENWRFSLAEDVNHFGE